MPARASRASIFFTADCAPPWRNSSARRTGGDNSLSSSSFVMVFLSRLRSITAPGLQPLQQLRNLVDPGDGAARDLSEFSIDLRCGRLCNPARGLREAPIDVKTTIIDLGAQHPMFMLGGR